MNDYSKTIKGEEQLKGVALLLMSLIERCDEDKLDYIRMYRSNLVMGLITLEYQARQYNSVELVKLIKDFLMGVKNE